MNKTEVNPVQVSVVIPLYNKKDVIARAIKSVMHQTCQNFEIIVVNDGSTDAGQDVVSEISDVDARIRLIYQANAGPGSARNHGLKQATGEYILFLDADDEILPEFLDTAVKTFADNPDVSVYAASHYRTVSGKKKDFTPYFREYDFPSGNFKLESSMDVYSILGLVWFYHSSTVVCKREVVIKHGGYYDAEKSLFGEDSYLWIQVLFNEVLYCDFTPLGWYHTEDSSLCAGGNGKEVPAFLKHPNKLRESCPEHLRKNLDELFSAFSLLYAVSLLTETNSVIFGLVRAFPRTLNGENGLGIGAVFGALQNFIKSFKSGRLYSLVNGHEDNKNRADGSPV